MKKKIKIVYLLGTFVVGGTQTQTLETLRRLDRERFELRVVGFGEDGILRERIEALGIPVKMCDFDGISGRTHLSSYVRLFRFLSGLIAYLRQEQPDIVQTYLFWANIYGCIAAKFAGTPVIITGRRGLSEQDILRPYYRWLLALSNRWATIVLTNSEAVKQHSLTHESGISAEKIRVVHNGVDCQRYRAAVDVQEKKRALGISPDAPIIGIVSNLRDCKGLEDAVEAAALVSRTFPSAVWLFIGRDDGLLPELTEQARRLGVLQAVRFLGQRDDVPELLAMMDMLLSSSHSEGLSNSILEGMAAGKAIIATHVGGAAELIEDGQTGVLIPDRNSAAMAHEIERLLRDPALREQFGDRARKKAQGQFSFEQMVRRVESLYDELCGKYE